MCAFLEEIYGQKHVSLETEFVSFIFELNSSTWIIALKKTEFESHNLNLYCLTWVIALDNWIT